MTDDNTVFEKQINRTLPDIPKVSVILPVYNVEEYILRCIKSLQEQTMSELEFIFIDDCSTDGSMELVEEWAAEDIRVHILRNGTNLGAGPSRNRGIEVARGDYLSFIDPDDYISPNFYELLYTKATTGCRHDIAKGVCRKVEISSANPSSSTNLNEIIRAVLADKRPLYSIFSREHWSAIFSKALFIDTTIRYGSSLYGEDVTFLLRCCYRTNDIVMDNRATYYYVQRSNSSTYARPPRKAFYRLDGLEEQLSFLAQNGVTVPEDEYTHRRCDICLTDSYRIYKEYPEFNSELSAYIQRFCGIVRLFDGYDALLDKSIAVRAALEYGRLLPTPSRIPPKYLLEGLQEWVDFLAETSSENATFYHELSLGIRNQIKKLWKLKPAPEALKATRSINRLCKCFPIPKQVSIRMSELLCIPQTLRKYIRIDHNTSLFQSKKTSVIKKN